MQHELKNFIKENSSFIYEYINTEILKDIGIINPNYFVKIIQDIFINQEDNKINEYTIKPNILPYFIFTLLANKGKIDYTSLRAETIDFKQINKESATYYNYARFTLKDNYLLLELIQSKFGGMPVDEDIVKFDKKIPIKSSGLKEFISKNKGLLKSNDKYKEIEKSIENIKFTNNLDD